jgi:4-hydroxy-3-methylbut-2-en-1-yl diphosphate reductase
VRLTVLAPLRLEAWALRRGLRDPGIDVIRVGMGAARARRAGTLVPDRHERGPIAVAGVCGGVAEGLRAGVVVVASTLVTADGIERTLEDSERLADAVRELGLECVAGPVLSVERLQRDARRAAAGHTGVLAVDMESAWIADALPGPPVAVLRVVADAGGRSVYRPRTLLDGALALAGLRRAAPALGKWASAVAQGVETRTIEPIAGRLQKEVVQPCR